MVPSSHGRGRKRWSERVVLVRVEEVPDHDTSLEGGENPLIAPTTFFPGFGLVEVCER